MKVVVATSCLGLELIECFQQACSAGDKTVYDHMMKEDVLLTWLEKNC
jgi:hypothetical protein